MVSRGQRAGSNANGSHVAQKLGKTRQNGRQRVFDGPPIPMHTPPPENRATAVLTPFPGIPTSTENPDSRSAVEIPRSNPVSAAHGSARSKPDLR